jgi:hypothetical protein
MNVLGQSKRPQFLTHRANDAAADSLAMSNTGPSSIMCCCGCQHTPSTWSHKCAGDTPNKHGASLKSKTSAKQSKAAQTARQHSACRSHQAARLLTHNQREAPKQQHTLVSQCLAAQTAHVGVTTPCRTDLRGAHHYNTHAHTACRAW